VRLLYAVDPGTIQSALVVVAYDGPRIEVQYHDVLLNGSVLERLRCAPRHAQLVIEQIESMGMAVGQEVFTTVWWAGRFFEAWPNANRYQLPRRPIKLHLCGSMQAKDTNIRRALLDRFGGDQAIGTTKARGPLYGLKGHEFQALAVGVTWHETHAPAGVHAVTDASGRVVAGPQPTLAIRPEGPWTTNSAKP
jgi:hypothetical protein